MNTNEASEKIADFSQRLDRVERRNTYTINRIHYKLNAILIGMGMLTIIAFLIGLAL